MIHTTLLQAGMVVSLWIAVIVALRSVPDRCHLQTHLHCELPTEIQEWTNITSGPTTHESTAECCVTFANYSSDCGIDFNHSVPTAAILGVFQWSRCEYWIQPVWCFRAQLEGRMEWVQDVDTAVIGVTLITAWWSFVRALILLRDAECFENPIHPLLEPVVTMGLLVVVVAVPCLVSFGGMWIARQTVPCEKHMNVIMSM